MDVTIKQLAELTQRHIETLRRLARTGKLPGAYRIGSRWMVRSEAVQELRGSKENLNTDPTEPTKEVRV